MFQILMLPMKFSPFGEQFMTGCLKAHQSEKLPTPLENFTNSTYMSLKLRVGVKRGKSTDGLFDLQKEDLFIIPNLWVKF